MTPSPFVRRLIGTALFSLFAHAVCAEPGVSDSKLILGQTVALSGPTATVGQDIASGLNAAFNAINKKGGIHGRLIELKTLDDGFDPARAQANAGTLLGEGAFLLAGSLGTPQSNEAIKVASEAKTPLLCPFSGAESLRANFNRQVFHLRASYKDEVFKMVDQLATLGMQRIAMFYQNDPFGKEGLSYLEEALKERNLKVHASASIERGSLDVAPAVKTLMAAQPQAVIMFTVTRPAAEFVKQMRAAGGFQQFFTISINANNELIENTGAAGRGVANTQIAPNPWDTAKPLVKEYQQAMRDSGKDSFSVNSLEAFLCGKVIAEGLRRSGRNLTRDRFIDALETFNRHDLGGHEISFTPSRHIGSTYVDLTVIGANGKFMR
jgi:ABC-type branched-subunit amino acid transport system substrate-binding protein